MHEEKERSCIEQALSSTSLPPLPDLFLNDFGLVQVQTSQRTNSNAENQVPRTGRVIEVPKHVLPPDYDKYCPQYPRLGFDPDIFQKQALYYLVRGESVFVTAHTSSGKTLVAEFAVHLSEKHETRMVYTSPIKALSNQKYREFSQKFESVGILTGDAQINSTARCVIMTTEILRNMLYRGGSNTLENVEFVVFDEIHYLGDRERGVVWEEVIILLPRHVTLVFLSATSPNAWDMSHWISHTKNRDVYLIGTEKRAVGLEHAIYFRGALYMLCRNGFFSHEEYLRAKNEGAQERFKAKQKAEGTSATARKNLPPRIKTRSAHSVDSPLAISRDLLSRNLAPIIFFDFSKSRVEHAFSLCDSLDLTTEEEKPLISGFVTDALQKLPESDRSLPQIRFVVPRLIRGVGVHHSGLLPILKEIVEILFATGAIRIMFATETLAMGLNMPARTVVVRTTRKYSPEAQAHVEITAGEYLQMAGRAGRRGYDTQGTAIIENAGQEVLPESFLQRLLAGKASRVESRFRVSPRMILALLRAKTLSVEEMVRLSFGESRAESGARKLLLEKQRLHSRRIFSEEEVLCSFCSADAEAYVEMYNGLCSRLGLLYSLFFSGEDTPRKWKHISSGKRIYCYCFVSGDLSLCEILQVSASGNNRNAKIRVVRRAIHTPAPLPYARKSTPRVPHTLLLDSTAYADVTDASCEAPADILIDEVMVITDTWSPEEKEKTDMNLVVPLDLGPREGRQAELMQESLKTWDRMQKSVCAQCPDFPVHYNGYLKRYLEKKEAARIDIDLQRLSQDRTEGANYVSLVLFLQAMGYVDENTQPKLKGRVACEFSTFDCVLATELLFSSIPQAFPCAHLITAALSLAFKEKLVAFGEAEDLKKGNDPRYEARIEQILAVTPALNALDDMVTELLPVFRRYNVPLEMPNHCVSGELLMWLEGYSLLDILQASPLSEGVIVKYIKKATEICTEFSAASKTLGITELAEKVEEVCAKLKRGIIFTPSLYYG